MQYDERLELLSAYLDGETTPDEAAAVEEWLAESEEARRELDELKHLSSLLRSLPTLEAPQELSAAVMRRAEREMLLGRAEALAAAPQHGNPSPSRPVPSASSRMRRRWLFAAGGLLTSCLAVVLAVQLVDRPHESAESTVFHTANSTSSPRDPQSAASAESFEFENSAALAESSGDVALQTNERPMHLNGVLAAPEDSPPPPLAPPAASAEPAFRNAADGALAKAGDSPSSSRSGRQSIADDQAAESRMADGRREAQRRRVIPQNARIGDVYEYLDEGAEGVTIVEMTVVDVKQAVNSLQVLLAENRIPQLAHAAVAEKAPAVAANLPQRKTEPGAGVLVDKGTRSPNQQEKLQAAAPKDADAAESDRVMAIYVQSTPDRLGAALEQLTRDQQDSPAALGLALAASNLKELNARLRDSRGAVRGVNVDGTAQPQDAGGVAPPDSHMRQSDAKPSGRIASHPATDAEPAEAAPHKPGERRSENSPADEAASDRAAPGLTTSPSRVARAPASSPLGGAASPLTGERVFGRLLDVPVTESFQVTLTDVPELEQLIVQRELRDRRTQHREAGAASPPTAASSTRSSPPTPTHAESKASAAAPVEENLPVEAPRPGARAESSKQPPLQAAGQQSDPSANAARLSAAKPQGAPPLRVLFVLKQAPPAPQP